jgi:hypothetical protein
MILTPKNWADFQHYKDRSPPWVKLHKTLLEDRDFSRLPIASKALAPMLWLLASESKDGSFDASIEELVFRLRWTEKDIRAGLKPLIDKGLFIVASTMLAESLHLAVPETEGETEGETEKSASKKPKSPKKTKTTIPENFGISDLVRTWAEKHNHQNLEKHFESFVNKCRAKGYEYADWDAAFRNAITDNWANISNSQTKIKTRQSANGIEWLHPDAGWVLASNVPMPTGAQA